MGVREMFGLDGAKALVLGGGGPVGRAIAGGLAEAGADVCLASLTQGRDDEFAVNSAANEIWALGRKGRAFVIDATNAAQVRGAVEGAAAELGGLTVLVNNTDRPLHKPALDTSYDEWTRTLALNVGAAFVASQAAARLMIAAGGGRIINVTSILGERGMANDAAYGAAKAALIGLTRSLAIEWAREGVRVNAIGLGWIEGAPGVGADEGLRAQLGKYVPTRRLGRPEEVAGTAVYMASAASDFMTGEVVFIDGAALAHA